MNQNPPVWGLHCNENIDLVGGGFAAMGWDDIGDLSKLEPTPDAFKAKVGEIYSDMKRRAIPQCAGQLYRFTHEVREGDLLVYRERAGARSTSAASMAATTTPRGSFTASDARSSG